MAEGQKNSKNTYFFSSAVKPALPSDNGGQHVAQPLTGTIFLR